MARVVGRPTYPMPTIATSKVNVWSCVVVVRATPPSGHSALSSD